MSTRHFRAQIRARTPEEGGRTIPIFIIGYRPDLAFENEQYLRGAALIPDAKETELRPKIELGAVREVDFALRLPAEIMPRLRPGTTFRMMEGRIAVADGVITLIYDATAR